MPGKYFFIFLPLIFLPAFVIAQGCSDAGFCTMGSLKPDQPFSKKFKIRLHSAEISYYYGQTTLIPGPRVSTPVVQVTTLELNFSTVKKHAFQVKIPCQIVNGKLGHASGAGDLSLSYTINLLTRERYDIILTLGAKIPTNHSNLMWNGLPLPMYYQVSLGTYDAIAGISFISRDWLFATGIQHPFNKNKNGFTWSLWQNYPDQEYLHRYPVSKGLKRGTDVMFRVERNFRYSRLNIAIGTLPIIRINKDEITDPVTGLREKMEGTSGMAMTMLLNAGYSFNVRSGIKFLYGRKFIYRKMNPDGLARHAVMTAGFYYRF